MKKNILIAHATDGMKNVFKKEVLSISVWMDNRCNHSINDESVSSLIKKKTIPARCKFTSVIIKIWMEI